MHNIPSNWCSVTYQLYLGLPCWLRRSPAIPRFNPWGGKIPWRREWLPTPVFLPEEFHGQRSLSGYCPWTCKELDMTGQLTVFINIVNITLFTRLRYRFLNNIPYIMSNNNVIRIKWITHILSKKVRVKPKKIICATKFNHVCYSI